MNPPELAIIGHPNEGKSSVLSTLAEDDSVRVSPIPGETTECRSFPIRVDNRELIRFTDTPGFQNPARVLSMLKKLAREAGDLLELFQKKSKDIPELHDDRELLRPLMRGAGIVYVVDGSRPVRNVDRAEMEILRLTGKPRMAILNCKDDSEEYLSDWKKEFRLRFNSQWRFNAHRATYAERILLLEALAAIDQDWQPRLTTIVNSLRSDWDARIENTADLLVEMIAEIMTLQITKPVPDPKTVDSVREQLSGQYMEEIRKREMKVLEQIRTIFKHNLYVFKLPEHSILREELFGRRTWQILGLSRKQVLLTGGLGGAAIGATLDVATLGHSLGLFATVGGVAGALTAFFGGRNISNQAKLMGVPLGGEEVKIGPPKHIDLLFVLLNRGLLYFRHTINRAHGRRDMVKEGGTENNHHNFTADWDSTALKCCHDFHRSLGLVSLKKEESRLRFRALVLNSLKIISDSEKVL